jgi:hypothetical protein
MPMIFTCLAALSIALRRRVPEGEGFKRNRIDVRTKAKQACTARKSNVSFGNKLPPVLVPKENPPCVHRNHSQTRHRAVGHVPLPHIQGDSKAIKQFC